ncbi:MAG: VOC family protein [Deltaproteobacteria bacterium]|nr:VOC family protein [Deltaproteobacteria bacterium]
MALDFVSVVHVNVNCSALARSLAFYRDALGLMPLSHTNPVPQDGAGFGLAGRVQWDAWIIHDDRGQAAQGIDLLEWKQPPPVGRPALANELGLSRLVLGARSASALHARLGDAHALAAPALLGGARFGFVARDPDGALLEIADDATGAATPRFAGVAINVASLARAVPWYERLLGLRASAPATCRAEGVAFGLAGEVRWREATFAATPTFAIRIVEWQQPLPARGAARSANALGLYRMALLVDDAARACAQLDSLGLAHSGSVWLDMGPDIPIEGLHAGFFPDPDGACLEWIERPRVRAGA